MPILLAHLIPGQVTSRIEFAKSFTVGPASEPFWPTQSFRRASCPRCKGERYPSPPLPNPDARRLGSVPTAGPFFGP